MCYSGWGARTKIQHHPVTGGFLSHCGWNSALESVRAGVPILAWSRGADLHLTCRFLVDTAHVAMKLQKEAASESDMLDMVANPVGFVRSEESAAGVVGRGEREDGDDARQRGDGDGGRRGVATELQMP